MTVFDVEHYICPEKAKKRWVMAREEKQTLYIWGMSGVGKTALITDMLNGEKYKYISAETMEADSIAIENNDEMNIIVIDDIDRLSRNPYFENYKKNIKKLISDENVWLIIAGRCEMPSWLIPEYYNGNFMVIEESNFALSNSERRRYFESWELDVTDEELEKIQKFTRGHMLAERVFAMHLKKGKKLEKRDFEKIKNEIWEYSWERVYSEWPANYFEMVVKLSAVDEFTLELAKMITGESNIESCIKQMKEIGCFLWELTDKDEIKYCIRPGIIDSFRYLISRNISEGQRKKLYFNIGYYYEMKDDLLTAIKYYDMAGDMEQMGQVLIKNSKKNPGSAHYFALRSYYFKLPKEIILKSPSLMNGMCMLQSLLLNPDESEEWYEELKKYSELHSGSERKLAKRYLFILDIALPHRGDVDLIEILKNTATLIANRKIIMPELSVTSNSPSQMNGGKDFCEWTKKDVELANTIGKPVSMVLGKYGKALVNLALAESFFEKGQNDFDVMTKLATGRMQADSNENYEQIFVADGILAWLYIMREKPYEAIEVLENYKKKVKAAGKNCVNATKLISNVDAFLVRVGLYVGKIKEANEWLQNEAPDENVEFITYDRFKYLTKIRIYIMNGRYEAAISLIHKMLYYTEIMHRNYIEIECLLLLAIAEYKMKNENYIETFKKCIKRASEYKFTRIITREGTVVRSILEKYEADEEDDEEYIKKLRSECKRMHDIYPGYLKDVDEAVVLNDNALLILKLQAEGASNTDIAEKLGINLGTVKYHNKSTYKKLGVKDKTSAVTEARKRGLI